MLQKWKNAYAGIGVMRYLHSWHMDETYIKVKGRWTYLYRAVDQRGHTIDFYLSARRNGRIEPIVF